jgi:hypothetical protein
MRPLLLAVSLVLASCGGISAPSPSATLARTSTPIPTTAASPTAAPSPTALTSAKGGITVARPLANARVTSPLVISGDASVFEAALQWRVTDSAGRVVAQGITTASLGAPGRGTFSVTATFAPPAADLFGSVEVFDVSPKDGAVDEIVRVPVVITR